jgi:hypothetical protein
MLIALCCLGTLVHCLLARLVLPLVLSPASAAAHTRTWFVPLQCFAIFFDVFGGVSLFTRTDAFYPPPHRPREDAMLRFMGNASIQNGLVEALGLAAYALGASHTVLCTAAVLAATYHVTRALVLTYNIREHPENVPAKAEFGIVLHLILATGMQVAVYH